MSIYGTSLINSGYQESSNIFDSVKECTWEDFLETYYEGISFIDSRLYALSEGYILEAEGDGKKLDIKEVAEKVINTIKETFNKVADWLKKTFEKFKAKVKEKFQEMQQNLITKKANKLDYKTIEKAMNIIKNEDARKSIESEYGKEFVSMFDKFTVINIKEVDNYYNIKRFYSNRIWEMKRKCASIYKMETEKEIEEIVSYVDTTMRDIKEKMKNTVRSNSININNIDSISGNRGALPDFDDDDDSFGERRFVIRLDHGPTESDWKKNVDFLNNYINSYNKVDKSYKEDLEGIKTSTKYNIKLINMVKEGKDIIYRYGEIRAQSNDSPISATLREYKELLKIDRFEKEIACMTCRENMKLFLSSTALCFRTINSYHSASKKIIKFANKADLKTE